MIHAGIYYPTGLDKTRLDQGQAEANGVMDLVWLSGADGRSLEPGLVAERALFSPSALAAGDGGRPERRTSGASGRPARRSYRWEKPPKLRSRRPKRARRLKWPQGKSNSPALNCLVTTR